MCLRCRVYQTLLALHSNVITASSFRHSYGHRSGPIPAIGMAIPVSTIIHPIPTLGTEPLTGTTPERRMESCRVVIEKDGYELAETTVAVAIQLGLTDKGAQGLHAKVLRGSGRKNHGTDPAKRDGRHGG